MRWDDSERGGFTTGRAWLPVHPDARQSVATERGEPTSTLHLVRALIALRADELGDASVRYRTVEVGKHRWVFDSGPLRVTANFSDEDVPHVPTGTAVVSSRTVAVNGSVTTLQPWEAVIEVRTPAGD
jgi:oligo-1,6-glucosidase